jgi:S1-C subfamily serine protease
MTRPTFLPIVTSGLLLGITGAAVRGNPPPDAGIRAERAEAARIAMIERITPSVVAIFDENERGGGTGVLIDADGYGVTNYHVVAGMLETGRGLGGLADGKLYPLEVLGIDPGGDLAMFRLRGRDAFDFATLGDSDTVRVGDNVVALGNPFMLAEDYTPTVTYGVVSGVNRYQWGAGKSDTLLYSDCIQVDAAINPGNSGGPLFNLAGEVIGINGRISVSLRGRVNVGLGYAITVNQVRMFLPGMRAGLLVHHGTMQAVVRDRHDGSVVFTELREDGPAWKIGVRPGDRLIRFDGRPIASANTYASILGTLPANWPVPVIFENADGSTVHAIARTEAVPLPDLEGFEPEPAHQSTAVERLLGRAPESGNPHWREQLQASAARWRSEGEIDRPRIELAIDPPIDPEAESSHFEHAGADRLVAFRDGQLFISPPLASLRTELQPNLTGHYLFDPATGLLHAVRIEDAITRSAQTLEVIPPDMLPGLPDDRSHRGAGRDLPPVVARVNARTVKLFGAKVGRSAGFGSGILVSSTGWVLTTDSALLDGRNARAQLADGTTHRLAPVLSDRTLQLALLQLVAPADGPPWDLPYFDVSAERVAQPGDWVLVAGNPFKVASGAEPVSLARGVVAGRTRLDATRGTQDFPYRGDVLLLDAITSTPGFAGGAVISPSGDLLGIVGRMVESRMTHTMLNHAIPADVLAGFIARAAQPDATRESEDAQPAPVYHGIKFFELGYRSNPVYVERVRRRSPAAGAGVRKDDLIIGANGQSVPNLQALERIIAACRPGEELSLTVMRKEQILKLTVTLEEAP